MIALMFLALFSGQAQAQFHEVDKQAHEAFAQVLKKYRELPVVDVESTVKISMGEADLNASGDEVTARIQVDKQRRGMVMINGFTCRVAGGEINVTHEATEESYFNTPDDGSPYYAMMNLFRDLPYPHLAIALGDESVEDVCMQLHSKAPWIVPTQVSEIQENGLAMQRIRLTSDNATFDLFVEPASGMLIHATLEITGGMFTQPGTTLRYEYQFKHTPHTQPLDPVVYTFEPGERQRVMMLATLMPEPEPVDPQAGGGGGGAPPGALVGKKAPDFILATLEGNAIDLEELRGQVVVLDFWASWCGPCVQVGLPTLHEVAQWSRKNMHPVKILTINVWERPDDGDDTPQQRMTKARKCWEDHNFSLPIAMDFTDETADAYGVTGVPTTVIIRADGIVHAQHVGAVDAKKLQADINGAIKILEDEPN